MSKKQKIILETKNGMDMGVVTAVLHDNVEEEKIDSATMPHVVRLAEERDVQQAEYFRSLEPEAMKQCQERIEIHALPMKLIQAEYTFNGGHLTFYFTAEGRVDFRSLVKDLTAIFKTRVELRQIGPRDETRILGGLGRCGRLLCCSSWLDSFTSINLDMSANQFLGTKNTEKITGMCGRLLCCLAYENEYYLEQKKKFPSIGSVITAREKTGEVLDVNIFKNTIKIRLSEDKTVIEVSLDDWQSTS